MSSVKFSVVTAEIALVGATAKTVLQVAPAANHPIKISSWGCFFDGTSVTEEPVLCELIRSTTAGTGSASPPSPRPLDDDQGQTIQTTVAHNFTAEPTMGDLIDAFEVHPQAGMQLWFPMGWEPRVNAEGTADWLNIRCTAPAGVNVLAKIFAEE